MDKLTAIALRERAERDRWQITFFRHIGGEDFVFHAQMNLDTRSLEISSPEDYRVPKEVSGFSIAHHFGMTHPEGLPPKPEKEEGNGFPNRPTGQRC